MAKTKMTPEGVDTLFEVSQEAVNQITIGLADMAFTPRKIIRSGDVTVVFWSDNSKTLVRRDPEDADNLHTAFCAALAKKIFGSNTRVKKIIDAKLARSKDELRDIKYEKALKAYKHKNHLSNNEITQDIEVKVMKEVMLSGN